MSLSVRFGRAQNMFQPFETNWVLQSQVNAIDFYYVNHDNAATGEPIFGTARLYRGKNAWARETNPQERISQVKDTWIDFTSDDVQSIYYYREETYTGELKFNLQGEQTTVLKTSLPIYYLPRTAGHLLIPPANVDQKRDRNPKYAVARVLAYRDEYSVSGEVISISSTKNYFDNRNIDHDYQGMADMSDWEEVFETIVEPKIKTYESGSRRLRAIDMSAYNLEISTPELYDVVTGRRLVEDIDYRLGKWEGTDQIDGSIVGLNFTGDATAVYEILQDVTHLVADVKNLNEVWLKHSVSANKFKVEYRTVPSNIIRPSIKVTESYGDSEPGITYKEGADFQLDLNSGTITRMSGGKIGTDSDRACYVDFQYISEVIELETYHTWCFVDSTEPVKAEFDGIDFDTSEGEKFYLEIPGGRMDLTNATEFPALSRGWHRFTVLSLEYGQETSGIRKVLSLLDKKGDPIFSGTKYFSEIRAFREPLTQVTETRLKYGVRKNDHTKFAMKDGLVLTNFRPWNSIDLVTLRYDPDLATLQTFAEQFELSYMIPAEQTPNAVRLRATIRRAPTTDEGLTPKIFSWALRISR
jgi:hypothetical protein